MFGVLLLGLMVQAVPSAQPAGATEHGAVSVVEARLRKAKWTGEETCPSGNICLRWPNNGKLDLTRQIAGAPMPKRFHARIWLHTIPAVPILMLVERLANGKYEVREWGPCLPMPALERYGLALPKGFAVKKGEQDEDDYACPGSGR